MQILRNYLSVMSLQSAMMLLVFRSCSSKTLNSLLSHMIYAHQYHNFRPVDLSLLSLDVVKIVVENFVLPFTEALTPDLGPSECVVGLYVSMPRSARSRLKFKFKFKLTGLKEEEKKSLKKNINGGRRQEIKGSRFHIKGVRLAAALHRREAFI